MSSLLEIRGFVDREGRLEPVLLRVSEPRPTESGDYACTVHAPAFVGRDRSIIGADERQASALAIQFLKTLVGETRVVDRDRVEIPW